MYDKARVFHHCCTHINHYVALGVKNTPNSVFVSLSGVGQSRFMPSEHAIGTQSATIRSSIGSPEVVNNDAKQ